jgi:hypothetical protein
MDDDISWLEEFTAPLIVIGGADESLKIQDFGVSICAAQSAVERRWYEL